MRYKMKNAAHKSKAFILALLTGAALTALPAGAQTIERGQLGAAQAFDAGVIDANSGGLDSGLWQGTSAATATYLLKKAPYRAKMRSCSKCSKPWC